MTEPLRTGDPIAATAWLDEDVLGSWRRPLLAPRRIFRKVTSMAEGGMQ